MDWQSIINVGSFLTGLFGIGIGIYGLRKAKTASQAEKAARRDLLNQLAAENFREMAATAVSLASFIRSTEWNRTGELATALRSGLAQALGAWSGILIPFEKDKLRVVSGGIRFLIEMIPGAGGNIEPEKHQAMLLQCDFVIEVVSEVAGRLKYPQEPQENL